MSERTEKAIERVRAWRQEEKDKYNEHPLIKALVESRYEDEDVVYYASVVASLVRDLIEIAEEKGMNLSRWQLGTSGMVHLVTWAAYKGKEAKTRGDLPQGAIVVGFSGMEGKTSRCKAFRKLKELRKRLLEC